MKKKKDYSKGKYGHSKHYRNKRLFMTLLILAFIVFDVVFSLVVFHTRKTLFVIVACIMSIPFARNLIDLFMSLKAKPLAKESYMETVKLSEETGVPLLYDITVTESEGIIYVPCLTVYNNNIICYTPDIGEVKQKEKIKKYISEVNVISDTSYRVFVTEKNKAFEKEIKKLHEPDGKTKKLDKKVKDNLLGMGF